MRLFRVPELSATVASNIFTLQNTTSHFKVEYVLKANRKSTPLKELNEMYTTNILSDTD